MAVAFMQLVRDELIDPGTGVPIRKLAVTGPPRHGKSTVVDEHGICWFLGHWPWKSVLHFTSSEILASTYDSAIATTLELNERHALTFPGCEPWPKKGWSFTHGRYLTSSQGKDPSFKAYGMGAAVLGIGGDLIVMDDPVDQRKENSEAEMKFLKDYYDGTIANRLNPGGDPAPNLPSLISRIFSGYGPNWGGLPTRWV